MNIEDFNSCLNYLQTLPIKKGNLDVFLPIVGTAIGVIIGFAANHYRDRSRENRTVANKILCIKEEIQRIQTHLEHVFSQCISLHEELTTKKQLIGHSLPRRIDSFFIDEHFIDVAHKLTAHERNTITNLLSLLATQNNHLSSMNKTFDTQGIQYWENVTLNTLNNALFCIRKCRSFTNNGQKIDLSIVDLADELGKTSKLVEYGRHRANDTTATP